jgi:hypothetical protein
MHRNFTEIICVISTCYITNDAEVNSASFLWTGDFLVDKASKEDRAVRRKKKVRYLWRKRSPREQVPVAISQGREPDAPGLRFFQ